jgi:hypothetical protein
MSDQELNPLLRIAIDGTSSRVKELLAENAALEKKVEKLSGTTRFCTECERLGKQVEEYKKALEEIANTTWFIDGPKEVARAALSDGSKG